MPDNIRPESLSWALSHVRRFGDTDIFPVPFEYDALAHDWNALTPFLNNIDLEKYKIHSDRRVMALKPGGGFRAAMQLDPLDHLVFTAAVYEAAESIESARIPKDQRVACSYRVRITPEGALFRSDTGWKDFHARSKELAADKNFSHVLMADISDFYNQIGQHRIQNAVESSTGLVNRSKNIEKFLNQITAKQSQGLPVGPFASIVLAEACLIDVDNFLLHRNVLHTRFVDDFRIFCTSRKQAVEIRHALTRYLFEVHRLSVESSKSYIAYIDKFVASELMDPHETEQQAKVDRLNEIFEEHEDENGPYWLEEFGEHVEKDLLSQAERESFVSLFKECVEKPPLNLGLARHLLRKALATKTTSLNNIVLNNFEALAPAMRDTIRYLVKTIPKKQAAKCGQQILKFCGESSVGSLPFVRMWILELLYMRPDMCSATEALTLAEESATDLDIRPIALLASAHKQVDWVRSRKETWRNYEPWSRRALIWSTAILPSGERRPFLSMVADQGDHIDAAVAKYLMAKK